MDINLSLKNTNFVKKKIFVFVEKKCIDVFWKGNFPVLCSKNRIEKVATSANNCELVWRVWTIVLVLLKDVT